MKNIIDQNQKLLLDLCAKSLFDKEIYVPNVFDVEEIINESKRQTVFSVIYPLIQDRVDKNTKNIFSQSVAKNVRLQYAHTEIHKLFSTNNISYVILKGVASASYYKEPTLRAIGDVDVLVSSENIAVADKLLNTIGFITYDDINAKGIHFSYKRKDGITCELHRSFNGVPANAVGEIIKENLSNIFEKSKEHNNEIGSCIIPCDFHHGIILLLHTASHLTHEGVGLRHLCDWAVFVNKFSNEAFTDLFESPLKRMGLWRFAQVLTLCCIKYLGCDSKIWAGYVDENLLENLIVDILNGGNFGFKDTKRYQQIKYINDDKIKTVSKRSSLAQLFHSINEKTKYKFLFVNKYKFLLPIGWCVTIFKYIVFILKGKRKPDNFKMINNATKRKKIYTDFHLFENDVI